MFSQHLGSMHPHEQALTLVLAFGPFVVLAIVILVRRRGDAGQNDWSGRGPDDAQR